MVSILGESLLLMHALRGSPAELMAETVSGQMFMARDSEQ